MPFGGARDPLSRASVPALPTNRPARPPDRAATSQPFEPPGFEAALAERTQRRDVRERSERERDARRRDDPVAPPDTTALVSPSVRFEPVRAQMAPDRPVDGGAAARPAGSTAASKPASQAASDPGASSRLRADPAGDEAPHEPFPASAPAASRSGAPGPGAPGPGAHAQTSRSTHPPGSPLPGPPTRGDERTPRSSGFDLAEGAVTAPIDAIVPSASVGSGAAAAGDAAHIDITVLSGAIRLDSRHAALSDASPVPAPPDPATLARARAASSAAWVGLLPTPGEGTPDAPPLWGTAGLSPGSRAEGVVTAAHPTLGVDTLGVGTLGAATLGVGGPYVLAPGVEGLPGAVDIAGAPGAAASALPAANADPALAEPDAQAGSGDALPSLSPDARAADTFQSNADAGANADAHADGRSNSEHPAEPAPNPAAPNALAAAAFVATPGVVASPESSTTLAPDAADPADLPESAAPLPAHLQLGVRDTLGAWSLEVRRDADVLDLLFRGDATLNAAVLDAEADIRVALDAGGHTLGALRFASAPAEVPGASAQTPGASLQDRASDNQHGPGQQEPSNAGTGANSDSRRRDRAPDAPADRAVPRPPLRTASGRERLERVA